MELQDLLGRADPVTRLHDDPRITHLHRATTGRTYPDPVIALAFDHRRQLEELARAHGADGPRIAILKSLVAEALLQFPPHRSGAIVDDGHGRAALRRLTGTGRWIARPVERPGSRPLQFEGEDELAIALRAWPAEHVVKCLVLYQAGDPETLRAAQESKLLELQRACHATGHRLLVEVIPPAWEEDPDCVAGAVARLYAIGLTPDWWKLPPLSSAHAWQDIRRTIADEDAHCRGALVLGLDRPIEHLAAAFDAAKAGGAARGFAIGRSVFRVPADRWLKGEISEAEFARDVAIRFSTVLQAWDE